MSLETINYGLALGTLAMQLATVAFLAVYLLRSKIPDLSDVANFLSKWGLWIGLVVSFVGSATTLIHSGIFGLPPCILCLWQRAFLYPQIVLFAAAILWKRTCVAANFSIALSVIGLCIAIYHHVLQMYPSGGLPCPSVGVSCAQIFFLEFGYITYPMMAISAFAFLIVLMLFVRPVRGGSY